MSRGFRGFRRNLLPDSFEPYEQTINYNGGIQSIVIPSKGLYKLEVYGAKGGNSYGATSVIYDRGINGAYACGYKVLNKGVTLYIGCGGSGGNGNMPWASTGTPAGGYNGGGYGANVFSNGYFYYSEGGGGGGTHIALENKTLMQVDESNLIIVAGGGPGGCFQVSSGSPSYHSSSTAASSNGTKGQGANVTNPGLLRAAGGGGFYGGVLQYCGTNYTNGVPQITYKGQTYSPSTVQDNNNGNGWAKITRIA